MAPCGINARYGSRRLQVSQILAGPPELPSTGMRFAKHMPPVIGADFVEAFLRHLACPGASMPKKLFVLSQN
jgi:hypothetical protein